MPSPGTFKAGNSRCYLHSSFTKKHTALLPLCPAEAEPRKHVTDGQTPQLPLHTRVSLDLS